LKLHNIRPVLIFVTPFVSLPVTSSLEHLIQVTYTHLPICESWYFCLRQITVLIQSIY